MPVRAADPVRGRMKETPSHIEPPALLGPEAPAPMRHEHRHYHIHEFELEQHSPEPNQVPPSTHDSRPHREEHVGNHVTYSQDKGGIKSRPIG